MPATIKTLLRNSLNTHLDIDGDDIVKDIIKPFEYTISVPGKSLRSNLVDVFRQWIEIPDDKLATIKALSHNIHNMTLMLDDIQDCSELRRGVPAAHKIYGVPRTILGADWVGACCLQLMYEQENEELTSSKIVEMYTHGFAGQGMELYWRDNYICPTQAEYLQAVYRKTCILFSLAPTVMNSYAINKQMNAKRFMTAFGVYFQIHDDYLNLKSKHFYDSKGFCEDITEGKFGFPMIHAVNNFPAEGTEIKEIMKLRTHDVEIKKRCLSILEKCGSFEYTRNVLKELRTVIDEELAKLPYNPLVEEFIAKAFYDNI